MLDRTHGWPMRRGTRENPRMLALVLVAALVQTAAPDVSRRFETVLARGSLDLLTLELASLDLEEVPVRQRPRLAATLTTAASGAPGGQGLFLLRRAVELEPSVVRLQELASRAARERDTAAEVEGLTGLLRLRPDDAQALARLAHLKESGGDLPAALALWRRVPSTSPLSGIAADGVARCQPRPGARVEPKPGRVVVEPLPPVAAVVPEPAEPPKAKPKPAGRRLGASLTNPSENCHTSTTPHYRLTFSDRGSPQANESYATQVHEILERVWSVVCARMGPCPSEPVPVQLFTSQEWERQFGRRWVGQRSGFASGAVYTSFGQAVTGNEELFAHEFVHVVIQSRTDAPKWVHEGFATYFAAVFGIGGGRPGFSGAPLCQSIRGPRAPKLSSLETYPWSGNYAQSREGYDFACAVARHLEDNYSGKAGQLIDALAAGKSDDQALRAVYGLGLDDLDAAVRATLPP